MRIDDDTPGCLLWPLGHGRVANFWTVVPSDDGPMGLLFYRALTDDLPQKEVGEDLDREFLEGVIGNTKAPTLIMSFVGTKVIDDTIAKLTNMRAALIAEQEQPTDVTAPTTRRRRSPVPPQGDVSASTS